MPLSSDAADLMPIAAALAELNDGELFVLIDAANNVSQIVPGLLVWIGHACDWELNRRAWVDFPLQSPDAAIPPEQDVASIAALIAPAEVPEITRNGSRAGCPRIFATPRSAPT